ncbi:hypothetical protein PHMEG_00026778 [Phytophthora megakarya]|uniref:Reverse transcriptase n=1 Tax=Phytophthora megakarya TaxID=4795 RepID=A0A225V8S7_9STRA|nr:hypothetical protein PHMEG_00026778 [Phytophthora megakarya]
MSEARKHCDWDSFQENPTFKLLANYKDNVFRPELPEGLPERCAIEHRIDAKDSNLAINGDTATRNCAVGYRHGKEEAHSTKHQPTRCTNVLRSKTCLMDYRYLNSNTIRQSIPMTRKDDILDAMSVGFGVAHGSL